MLATADPLIRSDGCDQRDPQLRLAGLFDDKAYDLLYGDDAEVWVGTGRINGARVLAYCTDARKMGGALGAVGAQRIVAAIEAALRDRRPVIGVWHSGGAKLADGVESMDGVGRMFAAMTRASGQVPQISVVVGPAAGAAAYGPALTDIIIMAPDGRVFVTGPDVVKIVTGEQIDMAGLGGPETHSRRSGVAHLAAESEADACARARRLVTYFTRPGRFDLDQLEDGQDLRAFLPESSRRAYDVRPLVRAILDSAMNSRSLGATAVFAWPDAEIAVMGAEAAVGILHRKMLAAAPEHERDALKTRLMAEHTHIAGGLDRAMAIEVLDEVISPRRTRRRLAEAIADAPALRGQHGNIPL